MAAVFVYDVYKRKANQLMIGFYYASFIKAVYRWQEPLLLES